MRLGYDQPLYLLPFDDGQSCVTGMFKFTPPLTRAEHDAVVGFAAGRTIFWDAVADYEAKRATRQQAVSRIAKRFREWVNVFERAQSSSSREGSCAT